MIGFHVQVSTNGYFSMGRIPQDGVGISDIPDLSSSQSIVAPFAADISTNYRGVVKYVNFSSNYPMDAVNYFIRNQLQSGDGFYGTRMMLAEWSNVPLSSIDFSYVCQLDDTDVHGILCCVCFTFSEKHLSRYSNHKWVCLIRRVYLQMSWHGLGWRSNRLAG